MTCRDVIEFLMDYASGALPEEERRVFDEHMAICPACVAYLKSYQAVVRLSKDACAEPAAPVPEDLVRAKIGRAHV